MTENGTNEKTPRIGVYLCHCGSNIAGMVNIPEVAEFAKELDDVALVRDYRFMCSEPGQELIAKDIREQGLERVVVAACSPLMHEKTFREAVETADLNRYLMQMANVREHCSWVTADGSYATEKAKALVAAAVGKAVWLEPLEPKKVPIHPDTLIVGGGIAGIQAALTIAEAGKKVYLVERSPALGGHMSHFDKTFPTLDCAACILTPKMVAVGKHPNVELLTWSEIEEVSGYIGNFTVKIRKKQRFVDEDRCNGCGDCWEECPSTTLPRKRRITIEGRLINERVL
ncbi:MAG: CoB--CoM heterodisulfide reductase iron-sulfur subunit A family protein [Deltaproteobacteria bacterium]|nr:CoB--CoM heterodisulfide reductase iron-sulfur subunit A family protein [Deltaproteobacteria bacterium]